MGARAGGQSRIAARAVENVESLSTRPSKTPSTRLPPPPRPPPELLKLRVQDYATNLALSTLLTTSFGAAALHSEMPALLAFTGALTVPLIVFQHDVNHAARKHKTAAEELVSAMIVL